MHRKFIIIILYLRNEKYIYIYEYIYIYMNILYGAKNVVLYYVLFHLILFYTYYSFLK